MLSYFSFSHPLVIQLAVSLIPNINKRKIVENLYSRNPLTSFYYFYGYIMYHHSSGCFFFILNHFYLGSLRFDLIAAYIPQTGRENHLFKNSTQVLPPMTHPQPEGWSRKRCPGVTNMGYLNIMTLAGGGT